MAEQVSATLLVVGRLTAAFPGRVWHNHLTHQVQFAGGDRVSLNDLNNPSQPLARELAWWTVAFHLKLELDGLDLEWSLASGTAEHAHSATVQRAGKRARSRVAVGWADPAGMALAVAATRAILGREP